MERFLSKSIYIAILPVILFVLVGCASPEESRKKDEQQLPGGLLDDYTGMERSLLTKQVYFYVNPEIDSEKYTGIIIDPVLVFVHAGTYGEGINATAMHKLSYLYQKDVARSLDGIYTLESAPGPDILRLRTAFLNVRPTVEAETGGLQSLSGVSMEAEFVDSVTGERVGSVLHYRLGKGYEEIGTGTPANRSRKILKKWAGLIRASADLISIK